MSADADAGKSGVNWLAPRKAVGVVPTIWRNTRVNWAVAVEAGPSGNFRHRKIPVRQQLTGALDPPSAG